jgi:hypothetical protein
MSSAARSERREAVSVPNERELTHRKVRMARSFAERRPENWVFELIAFLRFCCSSQINNVKTRNIVVVRITKSVKTARFFVVYYKIELA